MKIPAKISHIVNAVLHCSIHNSKYQKTLPEEVRQLIIDLHAEHPGMSWREIADICYIRYNRKPSHHSIKRIATTSASPRRERQYQPWHLIADPAERKLAVIWLHNEG